MPVTTRSQSRKFAREREQRSDDSSSPESEGSRKVNKRKKKSSLSASGPGASKRSPGYNLDLIADAVSCTVCMLFLKRPVQLVPCSHVFCNSCISKWLIRKRTCPCCRSEPTKLKCDVALQSILSGFREAAHSSIRDSLDCDREGLTCEMVSGDEMTIVEFEKKYKRIFQKVLQQRRRQTSENNTAASSQRLQTVGPETEDFLSELRRIFLWSSTSPVPPEQEALEAENVASRVDNPDVQVFDIGSIDSIELENTNSSSSSTAGSTAGSSMSVVINNPLPPPPPRETRERDETPSVMEIEGVLVDSRDVPDAPTFVAFGGMAMNETITELITRVMLRQSTDNWDASALAIV